MFDSLHLAFSALLLIVGSAHAQVNAPNCSMPTLAWSLNSLGQGPCLVAAYLASVCTNGVFSIPALLPQHSYFGPNGQDNGSLCLCNTVAYNLISACDACQGQPWITYSTWTTNCSLVAAAGTYPKPIPAGIRVPSWAYLDTTPNNTWNLTAAQLFGDSPEVTGIGITQSSIAPTSTTDSQPTVMPQTTSSSLASNSSPKPEGSTNTSVIAGGIIGGIVGAAFITTIVSWFAIRRRRARSAQSAMSLDGECDMGQAAVPYPRAIELPRVYDLSSPSTHPTQETSSMNPTMNYSGLFIDSKSSLRPNQRADNGSYAI